jgi:transcriptional antiterminator Rof (Rho-off)
MRDASLVARRGLSTIFVLLGLHGTPHGFPMTDTKNHSNGGVTGSLEGRVFQPASFTELVEAVELAFDYRGDVTVSLKSGESLSGYLFNRQVSGSDSYLEVFPSASSDARHIRYDQVAAIAFTGEDTATGKSWEAWVTKKDSERRAEVKRVDAEAKTRRSL